MSQAATPVTSEFLLEQALKLPVPERIELMHQISQSLPASTELPPLSDERRAELRRRVKHVEDHPDELLTWDQVESAVRNSK